MNKISLRDKWNQWGEFERRGALSDAGLPVGFGCWHWQELPPYIRIALTKSGYLREYSA